MPSQPLSLEQLSEYIGKYCETNLRPYLKSLEKRQFAPSAKEISDPIWNTIELKDFEVGLVDSPLIQRLRHIRQLGVVHWLYPGALHTRFEHSIGVLHAVEQLLKAIHRIPGPSIPEEYRHLLRLAGLVHDVGHGIFSHVSEKALQRLPTLMDIQGEFSEKYSLSDDKKMSEILTYLMLDTQPVKELLLHLQRLCPVYQLPQNYHAKLCTLFLDKEVYPEFPLLQEIISGPFDADKLDYLLRDAHMSGLPLVPDVPRLLSKVRVQRVSKERSPINMAEGIDIHALVGISLSGARTLDELMLARTWLFDKVYRHHKVRAVEGMITTAIERLYESISTEDFFRLVLDNDDRFLFLDEKDIGNGATSVDKGIVKDILQRIRSRDLICSCYAWSHNVSPQESSGSGDNPFDRIGRELSDSSKRLVICKKISAECEILANLLEVAINNSQLEYLIVIDPPKIQKRASETPRAFLITPDGNVTEFKKDSAESVGLVNAYLVAGDLGYVFGPREFSLIINLATEKVFFEEFGFRNTASSLQYTKIRQKEIDEAKQKVGNEYYKSNAKALRPRPPFLTGSLAEKKFAVLEDRFSSFQGVSNDQRESGAYKVNKDAMIRWLLQFGEDGLIESALKVLEAIKIVNRQDLTAGLKAYLDSAGEPASWFCALGGPVDSSSVYSYFGGDMPKTSNIKTVDLTTALERDGSLLFFDDFIGSGSQAISIISTWLDIEHDSRANLDECRYPLSKHLREKLKQRKLTFLFYTGFDIGVSTFQERGRKEGLSISVQRCVSEGEIPSLTKVLSDPELNAFQVFCSDVGTKLLDDGSEKHSVEWCKERSLGYGNRGYLIAFPFNIRTQSLTCLWHEKKSIPWTSLFKRRKKH